MANKTDDYLFCHVLCVERFDGVYIFTSQLVYIIMLPAVLVFAVCFVFVCTESVNNSFVLTCVRVARVCNCYHQLIVSCTDPNLESVLLLLLLFAFLLSFFFFFFFFFSFFFLAFCIVRENRYDHFRRMCFCAIAGPFS